MVTSGSASPAYTARNLVFGFVPGRRQMINLPLRVLSCRPPATFDDAIVCRFASHHYTLWRIVMTVLLWLPFCLSAVLCYTAVIPGQADDRPRP